MSKTKEESNFYSEFTGTFQIVDESDGEKVRMKPGLLDEVFTGFAKAHNSFL